MLNELFANARSRLPSITTDQSKYTELLKGLILQGLFRLMDAKVVLQCRAADLPLVKTAIPAAKEQYHQQMRSQVDIFVDEANCLPEAR